MSENEEGVVTSTSTPENEEQTFSEAFAEFSGGVDTQESETAEKALPEPLNDGGDNPVEPVTTEQSGADDKPTEVIPDSVAQRIKELEEERDKYRHSFESDKGRVSALQKTLNALKNDQARQGKDAVLGQAGADDMNNRWEQAKSDYPDIMKALEGKINAIREDVRKEFTNGLHSVAEPLAQLEQDRYRNQQVAALQAAHPDFADISVSDTFNSWLKTKPSAVQDLRNTDTAADAAFLISLYKAEVSPKIQPQDNTPPVDNNVAEGDGIAEKRRQQLAIGEAVPSVMRQPRTGQTGSGDFSSDFQYFAKKADERLRR